MQYDLEEIKGYLENFSLNEDGGFTDWDSEEFVGSISNPNIPAFNWEEGATKLVIIPDGRDYVIKIPFNGRYEYGDFFYFNGAYGSSFDDYCASEKGIYEDAEEAGFGEMFLPIELVCRIDGHPIYVQERVEMIDEMPNQASYASEKSKDKIYEEYQNGVRYIGSPVWAASCLDTLGSYEEYQRFLGFIDEEGISDLHRGNLGYCNGHAVIVDYGGYYE